MLKPLVALVATLILPTVLHAQACYSNPAPDRETTIEARRDATPDQAGYGTDLRLNFGGPVTAEVGYRLVTSDTLHSHGNAFHAGIAGELSLMGVSLCAGVAPRYSSFREPEVFFDSLGVVLDLQEQTQDRVTLPVELTAGKRFDYRGLAVLPSLGAAYVSNRVKVTSSKPLESSASSVEGRVALAIALQSLFGRVQLTTSTVEGADPTFSVGLGVLLR